MIPRWGLVAVLVVIVPYTFVTTLARECRHALRYALSDCRADIITFRRMWRERSKGAKT